MTLVVGEIHDGGITLVADTKVTYARDETRTRHVLENALPKLTILRRDLCVGIAGNDPIGVIESLMRVRHKPVADVIDHASTLRHASFVVAALDDAPALCQVTSGQIEERSSIGRAWAGDHAGYEVFQEQYAMWPPDVGSEFRLLSALQWLVTWNPVPSIGGYHTRVATTSDGFRFVADMTHIGPEQLDGLVATDGERLSIRLTPTPDSDPNPMSVICAPGAPPTFGALAYLVLPLGFALLFPHEQPADVLILHADSVEALLETAAEHGQHLTA